MDTLKMIRNVLAELTERIDSGRCRTTEEQNEKFLECLMMFLGDKEEKMNKQEAIRYLGMSRSKFDELRRNGELPIGRKKAGDVSREWTKAELDEYVRKRRY